MGALDFLKRQAAETGKLEGAHAEEFLRMLRETQRDLMNRIYSGDLAKPLDAFNINAIVQETQSGISLLESKATGFYGKAQVDTTELALEHVAENIDRLSRAFDAKPLDVSLDAQAVLADPGQRLLANHFETSVERYGLDTLNQVRQRLFTGLRAGDSVGDMASDLGAKLGPLGEAGQVNATRLVRTEMSQAYGSAQVAGLKETAKQVPGIVKTWFQTGSYDCPICKPLNKTSRPIDGTWTIRISRGKTREISGSPAHPNCVCKVVGGKKSWSEQLDKLGHGKPKK